MIKRGNDIPRVWRVSLGRAETQPLGGEQPLQVQGLPSPPTPKLGGATCLLTVPAHSYPPFPELRAKFSRPQQMRCSALPTPRTVKSPQALSPVGPEFSQAEKLVPSLTLIPPPLTVCLHLLPETTKSESHAAAPLSSGSKISGRNLTASAEGCSPKPTPDASILIRIVTSY